MDPLPPPASNVTVSVASAAPAAATGASPRITGAPASVAPPLDPPHPAARSITAQTTTTVALPEPDARLVKRLVRAPIANTIPLGDVVPSPCEPDEGYCRSVGSATVKTRCLRWVSLYGSTGPARCEEVHPAEPGSSYERLYEFTSSQLVHAWHAERAVPRRPGARELAGSRSTRANFSSRSKRSRLTDSPQHLYTGDIQKVDGACSLRLSSPF